MPGFSSLAFRTDRPMPDLPADSADAPGRGRPAPKLALEAAHRELTADIARGLGGRPALERFSDRLDAIIRHLVAEAPRPERAAAVAALGGYGRRHLCLHSDVDLLVLFDGPIGEPEERFLRAVLHPLWDLKLVVGHQVRELTDFAELETDNPEFLLAMVDARPIAGSLPVFERCQEQFHTAPTHAFLLDALAALVDARHARFNDTLYQLEPDVKDAPGALRDVWAARTIALITDPALLRLAPLDPARLDDAEDFLFSVRSVLHLEARRNLNGLSHEIQERVAEVLAYPGSRPQQRVERLMGDYFRHARVVDRTLRWVRRAAPRPVGPNLGRSAEGVRFIDGRQGAVQPATWVAAFQAALDEGCGVSDEALACMQQHADRYTAADFFPTPAHRAALLALLKPRRGLYARLSEMHDCGLLGRLFPEFQAITCRVVRDFYHKYTVDEHTLLTIRNLERLIGPAPGRERFASLIGDLDAPELLVLALLYHDIGKWRDDDHAIESVRMAERMCDRLGLDDDTRELLEFLIGNHLRMSQVAFRRDTEDPEIVGHFAELVGVEDRLKMLCLLTLADVEAVSLETLTPWREELLWRLYVDTYNQITQGYADRVIRRDQADLAEVLRHRPDDISDEEIHRFVEGLPRRYLQLFGTEDVYRHLRLSRDIHPDEVHSSLTDRDGTWELTVVTLDKPFLFSNVCGVLASYGMDILRGQAMTSPSGLVLDVFEFTDAERFFAMNRDGQAHVLRTLEDAVSGRRDVTEKLRRREESVMHRRTTPRVTPVVHVDNDASPRYTILDIITDNALGLLYRISRVISRHGCDVDLVLISTEGHKAIDVFHLTKAGAKLSDEEQRALAANLQRMLEDGNEVDQVHHPTEQGG
jgi:[protein-PII] uridylyltransferase